MFPVGTQVLSMFIVDDQEEIMMGRVYDFKELYWRACYSDGDCEELAKTEMECYGQQL